MREFLFTMFLFIPSVVWPAAFVPLEGIYARAISANGSVVVGNQLGVAGAFENGLVRWQQSTGSVVVASFINPYGGFVSAVSDDGTVITGYDIVSGSSVPIIWNQVNGITNLQKTSATSDDLPADISGNGELVVGTNYTQCCEGVKWHADGTIEDLDISTPAVFPSVGDYGLVFSISSDGSVMSILNTQGAFHLAGNTLTLIHPFEFLGPASQISSDGGFVVGTYQDEAYRFSLLSGRLGLGVLPNAEDDPPSQVQVESRALDVAANGVVVVGYSENVAEETEAFIWSETRGMESLKQRLIEEGVDIGSWKLLSAVAVSDDGLSIVGEGVNVNGDFQSFLVQLNGSHTVPMVPAMGIIFSWVIIFIIYILGKGRVKF